LSVHSIVVATDQEREVAAWIAELVQLQYGIAAGPATERDGRDDSGLTNDFCFDDAEPPFAVEVTRLRDDFEHPSADEHRRLERDLRRRLARNGWSPDWIVGIRPETKRSSVLEPAIARMIEWMVAAKLDTLGPGTYTHDVPTDLLSRMGKGFMQDCDRARMAGVILLRRATVDGVHVIPVVEFSDSKSLQRPLARSFEKKRASLGKAKARDYVTMLGVDVEREDAHGYLNEATRAPGFPVEIDHLWLIVRGVGKAFYARRDDRHLRVVDLPDILS
jgi:hypothetical protein